MMLYYAPSGLSSCIYAPVKYRWTRADFPLSGEPKTPTRSSVTPRDAVHS